MAKRVLLSLFTILVATTITFVLVHNLPGDVFVPMAMDMAQEQSIPFEIALETVRGLYGMPALDQPLYRQYFDYISRLFRGDLGESMLYHTPVIKIIASALPWTILVQVMGITLSFTIGTLIGMVAAWKRRGWLDTFVSAYSSITDATPDYLTALILLIVFAVNLKWLPLKGAYDVDVRPGVNLRFVLNVLYHAVLPMATYTLEGMGGWMLIMKSNAVSTVAQDYVKAAQAKGLRDRRIAINYVGRNAILAPVTSLAIAFGTMLGGATLIESVFAYPGIGFFFGEALKRRDYSLMQGLFLLTTVGIILANFLADWLYARLDPRVRAGG
ncbi:MAG TPA: ABC transporter permease [Chloroflexi bacterium]|nr:ABC transporter permease [Chloroflexota bacterium]